MKGEKKFLPALHIQFFETIAQRLQSRFDIPRGKGLPFALLAGQAFFSAFALSQLEIMATSLFLAQYSIAKLPYIYLAIGGVVSTLAFGVAHLQRLLPIGLLAIGYYAATIGWYVLSWSGLTIANSGWISGLLMVSYTLLLQLHSIVLGGQAGRLFDVREIKRVFPLIMTGHVVGFMAGGITVPAVVGLLNGVEQLLLTAAMSVSFAFGLGVLTKRSFRDELTVRQERGKTDSHEPIGSAFNGRYVRWVFVYQMLSALGTELVLFCFFDRARAHYAEPEKLSEFLGYYQAGMNFSSILFLVLLTPILFRRFGLGFGLAINPVVVAILSLFMLLAMVLAWPGGMYLFALATVARIGDIVLSNAMTGTAIKTSYQVLPPGAKGVVETMVEGIGVPLAYGLTGIALLLCQRELGQPQTIVAALIFVVSLIWICAARLAYRDYPAMLEKALTRHDPQQNGIAFEDGVSAEILDRSFRDPDAEVVLYAVNLAVESAPELLRERLPQLLAHPSVRIRNHAAGLLESQPAGFALPLITNRLACETESEVVGALIKAHCAAGGADVIDQVAFHLTSNVKEIRLGATVGLLRHGGIHGVLVAGRELLSHVESENASQRRFAAEALGEIGIRDFFQPLVKLLHDTDASVQLSAIRAAGKLQNPRLWPILLERLDSPKTRVAAITALSGGSDSVLTELERAFISEQTTSSKRLTLTQIAGRISSAEATAFLEAKLDWRDDRVRHQVFRSLSLRGYNAENLRVALVERVMETEVKSAVNILSLLREVQSHKKMELIRSAAERKLQEIVSRCFYLLSFLYESKRMLEARDAYFSFDSSQRGFALETIDVRVPAKHKIWVLPLLEEATIAQRLERLPFRTPVASQSVEQLLRTAITAGYLPAWLRVTAIYEFTSLAAEGRIQSALPLLEQLTSVEHPLVRETALWSMVKLSPEDAIKTSSRMLQDPNPKIGKFAAQVKSSAKEWSGMTSTIERVLFFRSIDLFKQIPDEDLAWIADAAEETEFDLGETFIRQGEIADCLYVVVEGQVDVLVDNVGKVTSFSEKSVIGEMAILANIPRTANCVAVTKVRALRLNRDRFLELLRENSDLGIGIIQVLVTRLDKLQKVQKQ